MRELANGELDAVAARATSAEELNDSSLEKVTAGSSSPGPFREPTRHPASVSVPS